MTKTRRKLLILLAPVLLPLACAPRAMPAPSSSGSGHADTQMAEMEHAAHSMASHHMESGLHMKMTALRPANPTDQKRAEETVATLREVLRPYRDYRAALQNGYRIFLPNVPQKMYHFTNWAYGFNAVFRFDADRPTSLLYEKTADSYRLIGAMYTARKNATEEELDRRVPLSVGQWHAHVNICMAPKGREAEMLEPKARFGLRGSIADESECSTAGGRWVPQLFGWMVHVYPFEKDPAQIWSLERQMGD